MNNERSAGSGFSGIGVTAVLSVVALIGALGWKFDQSLQDRSSNLTVATNAASSYHGGVPSNNSAGLDSIGMNTDGNVNSSSSDPYAPSQIANNVAHTLAMNYARMQATGTYSSTTAAQTAQALGASLKASVSYRAYSPTDIKTSLNTSYTGMLAYRSALQSSLAPLLKNTTPELDLITAYVNTNDQTYLTQLRHASDNYKLAAAASAQIAAPADAVAIHVGILNAMQEFAATLDQMAASANDPFVEATLINTYMQSQQDMFTSFNNLYTYYKSKQS